MTDVKEFSKLVRDRHSSRRLELRPIHWKGIYFRRPIPFLARPKPVMSSKRWSTACIGCGAPTCRNKRRMKLSLHQVLTLASVIEKETGSRTSAN